MQMWLVWLKCFPIKRLSKYINRFPTKRNVHKPNTSELLRRNKRAKEIFKYSMSGFWKCEYSQVFAGNDEYPPLVQKPSCRTKVCQKKLGGKRCPVSVRSRWAGSRVSKILCPRNIETICLTIFSEPMRLLSQCWHENCLEGATRVGKTVPWNSNNWCWCD